MSERPSSRLLGIDLVVIVLLGLLAATPLAAAYGGRRWAAAVVGGLLLGGLIALASLLLRLGPWLTALALAVAYLLFGPALATPDDAVAGFLPGPEALGALVTGIVDAWRDSLTQIAPLGSQGTVLIVPFVIGLIGGLLAATLLWRTRWNGAAGLVLLLTFIVAAAFGDSVTGLTVLRGLALATALIVWVRWRAARHVRVRWLRRIALTTAVVVLAGGVATGVAALTGPAEQREVLRDHVEPPFLTLEWPSPLARFRAYLEPLEKTALFTVDGVPAKTRVRLATMDEFDGIVWNVTGGADTPSPSGTFARVRPLPSADGEVDVTITIDKYTGAWVPSVGTTLDAEVTGLPGEAGSLWHNAGTGTLAQEGGVVEGATYRLRSVVDQVPSDAAIAQAAAAQGVVLPEARNVPANLVERATEWVSESGASAGGALALLLRDKFAAGYYSDGKPGEGVLSAAGHGAKRVSDLVAEQDMVGNAEQYASAMAAAGRRFNLPARVVIGFEVPSDGVVRGAHVDAWVEVALEELGWVPLSPTPPKDRKLKKETQEPNDDPQPQVLQPPTVPKEAEDPDQQIPQGASSDNPNPILAFILAVIAAVVFGVKVALWLAPLWGILLVKWLRRRRRRGADDPVVRLSGGWKEVTDRARDLGTRLPLSNTRYESSVTLADKFPESNAVVLATVADRHVFGPVAPTEDEVEAYWDDVETALGRMRKAVPWWRRPLAWFSPASIPWRLVWASVRGQAAVGAGKVAASPVGQRVRELGRNVSAKFKRRKASA